MENQGKFNQNEPLSCRINGHRIYPLAFQCNGFKTYVWCISPNRSEFSFYFKKISTAQAFAKKYRNSHSSAFWFRLFDDMKNTHLQYVLDTVKPLMYLL